VNKSFQLSTIEKIAHELVQKFQYNTIRFDGQLGAGKTTLIKAVCQQLGVKSIVNSPTFSIINCYDHPKGSIYHMDFYRIKHPQEALDLGIVELVENAFLNFIEWGDVIDSILTQKNNHHYQIEYINCNTRRIKQLK